MAKITTENFKAETTLELYNSFLASSGTNYYIMASATSPETDANGDAISITNTQRSTREFKKRVIFGNRVTQENLRYMFPIRNWEQNKVYDSYDDTKDVETLDMFVTVLDGGIVGESSYKVYKCIKNNNGGPSIENPTTSTDSVLNNFEGTLDDGYIWKFMFEVIPSEYINFGTNTLLPLPFPGDPNVIAAAKEEVSDVVIENTVTGLFLSYVNTSNPDIGVRIPSISGVSSVETSSSIKEIFISITSDVLSNDDAYKNMHLVTPTRGIVYDILSSSLITNAGNSQVSVIKLEIFNQELEDETDPVTLDLLTQNEAYRIVPKILISKSDGKQAVAVGELDEFGTLIDVNVIEKGSEYKTASATVLIPENAQTTTNDTFTLRCIVSPKGGHGSDPVKEMAMSRLGVVTSYSGTIENIPITNTYTQVGLVKGVEFSTITPYPLEEADEFGNIQYEETPITELPDTFDNRLQVVLEGNVTASIQAGDIVEKDVYQGTSIIETISAIVHEVELLLDGNTKIYLVDYDGNFIARFHEYRDGANELDYTIRIRDPDSLSFETAQINKSTNSVIYGNYKAYSGDVLHFVDFEPIERRVDRQEKIKFVFDF